MNKVLGAFRSWSICHVRREANQVVHDLAKVATSTSIDRIWIEETPNICIYDIVTVGPWINLM
jgi:hypothetical protein